MYAVETAIDILDLILATLAVIPVKVLLALLYATQLLMYEAYLTYRQVVADYGFTYPELEHLDSATAQGFTTTAMGCCFPNIRMGNNPMATWDPSRIVLDNQAFNFPIFTVNFNNHFLCPLGVPEEPITRPDFFPPTPAATPNFFMDELPFSEENLFAYANAQEPEVTRSLEEQGLRIGNARSFTRWMVDKAAQNNLDSATEKTLYTNWNLDSDRGYGYKEWEGQYDFDTNADRLWFPWESYLVQ